MSGSIAAQISTRPIRCLVDLHWGNSAAVVLSVAKSAHLRTSDRAVSCAWIRKDSPHLSVLVTRCSAEALFSSANQNSTDSFNSALSFLRSKRPKPQRHTVHVVASNERDKNRATIHLR